MVVARGCTETAEVLIPVFEPERQWKLISAVMACGEAFRRKIAGFSVVSAGKASAGSGFESEASAHELSIANGCGCDG